MTLPSFCEKVVSAPAPKITRKAPIAEGRGLLEVEVLQYCKGLTSLKAYTVAFPFLPLFTFRLCVDNLIFN